MKYERVGQLKKQISTDPFFGDAVGFVLGKIGDMQDKVILDSGCGTGEMSVFFALQGAKVIGIDKRKLSIDYAISLAQSFGVKDNCLFIHGYSESIPIHSESIDIIFSKSTIQYMDRNKVLNEYTRIIKPDGIVALIENLPYNPLIILYRLHRRVFSRTPQITKYVNSIRGYITPNEIESFADRFQYSEHHEYHLFRMISIYFRSLLEQNRAAMKTDVFISNLDKKLFSLFPFLKYVAWYTALYCKGEKSRCNS